MSQVFVLDTNKQPLNPVHPGRARLLLKQGQAAVFRRYPFTIILKQELDHPHLEPLRLKLDPGSKTTGLALVNDATGQVVWAAELTHRGATIKKHLDERRGVRRKRRYRFTRYRQPRFNKMTGASWPGLVRGWHLLILLIAALPIARLQGLRPLVKLRPRDLCKLLTSFWQFCDRSLTIVGYSMHIRMFGNRRICTASTRCSLVLSLSEER